CTRPRSSGLSFDYW
nr:immunoglobulin heavy chain junction region [Mus musculus]NSM03985.1 immunoglobulin heavy chain junction region [Mus musculus]NSM04610.1 immunoglobulin heavy chain junction region [Mus musculus]NSM04857.1 immunoglobulin heavy chain junction region [Mus musculus]NSM04865.1 immunoglobulin heavy chain junction region [Mus musculus]